MMRAPTTEPISTDAAYIRGLPMTAMTQMPPCGAGSVQPKSAESPPAMAEPMMQDGSTCPGSAAA